MKAPCGGHILSILEPTDQSADFSDHLRGDSDLIVVLPDLISHYSGWCASHNG